MKDRDWYVDAARKLSDSGKLIEAGWIGLRTSVIVPDAPTDQLVEMRMAFFAGASHVWSSVVSIMEPVPGDEPTVADLKRIGMIDAELRAFDAEFRRLLAARAREMQQ